MLCGSHIKIWNLANEMKIIKQRSSTHSFQFFTNRSSILKFFVLFFHVVCKISNLNMWTAKHLTQGSCSLWDWKPAQSSLISCRIKRSKFWNYIGKSNRLRIALRTANFSVPLWKKLKLNLCKNQSKAVYIYGHYIKANLQSCIFHENSEIVGFNLGNLGLGSSCTRCNNKNGLSY